MSEPAMERAASGGLPVVALMTRHVPDKIGYVNADNIGALHLLVAHLKDLGHRCIAYAGSAHSSNYLDRRDGFREAARAAGLSSDAAMELSSTGMFYSFDVYEAALDRWLALPAPPTAIIVSDDGLAVAFVEALTRRGLRVPEDMAVTGFDDVPDAARSAGGITTIRQPFREIGRKAVERLIALIEGAPVSECRVALPVDLVVRGSTRPSGIML
jgi:DNA-binding LacI/PurR family transcriptional regulator